jgi:hypothetical protein
MRPIELLEEIVGLNKWGNCNLSQMLHLLGPTHYLSGKGKTKTPFLHSFILQTEQQLLSLSSLFLVNYLPHHRHLHVFNSNLIHHTTR